MRKWTSFGLRLTYADYALRFDTELEEEQKKKPPYSGEQLGSDPAKCPGEGFEWRGKDPVGGKRGNWTNAQTGESLHPDIDHPPPKQPHWDYIGKDFPKGARLNLDGTWEPK